MISIPTASHNVTCYSAGGPNISDELSQIRSLKEKRERWERALIAVKQLNDKKCNIYAHEFKSGKIKHNLARFTFGEVESAVSDCVGKLKEFESFTDRVNDIKNKWETGGVERAKERDILATKEELKELTIKRACVKVKDRFQAPAEARVQKSYDKSELDGSSAADARKSFTDGFVFEGRESKKLATKELEDLNFSELNSFKNKFEHGCADETQTRTTIEPLDVQLTTLKQVFEKPGTEMNIEDRARTKKQEIDEEFLRFKMTRKLRERQQANQEKGSNIESGKEIEQQNDPFKGLEFEATSKAREKFKKIDAKNSVVPLPKPQGAKESKWNIKMAECGTTEIVNRGDLENDKNDSSDEAFDMKSLMNKFKNIANLTPKQGTNNTNELEGICVGAKNLRKQFENTGNGIKVSESKKEPLKEEFAALKEERERAEQDKSEQAEEAVTVNTPAQVKEVPINAQKMTAKWEKIHAKEAKKAEKSRMSKKINVAL